MSVTVKLDLSVYHNCDDVILFWRTEEGGEKDRPMARCLGFVIERQRKNKEGKWGNTEILRNRVGFGDDKAVDVGKSDGGGEQNPFSKPSNICPFQRYDWTDHGANNGDTVRYRVLAGCLPAGGTAGETPLEIIAASEWSEAIAVNADCGKGVSAYFNRGTVMSQFVARIMRQNNWGVRDIKPNIKNLEEPLRRFLSGELRQAMLQMLDEVIEDPNLHLYAALYELEDKELIGKLALLRERAHVVLSNGSNKQGDGNEKPRATLKKAKVDVRDRLLGGKGLGHNKFAVVVGARGKQALKAWTGSTNWSSTGLCTQLNNGILFDNAAIAKLYLEQWELLADAGNGFPAELVESNARSPRSADSVDVWFTRVRNASKKNEEIGADLQALVDLVKNAKSAVLYVMFQPGSEPLATIMQRTGEIYVRGVVSTLASTTVEKFDMLGIDRGSKEFTTDLIQPEGVAKGFSYWLEEVTRNQFLYPNESPGVGHAITHCKMMVIDPFSPDCAVVTGSHNFSGAASEKNDENFVIVRGNKALAEAYAVACFAIYDHYRWRAHLKEKANQGKSSWSHLSDNPRAF